MADRGRKELGTGEGVVYCSKPRGSTIFRKIEAPSWGQRLDGNSQEVEKGSFHLPSVQELQQRTSSTERQDTTGGKGDPGLRDQLIDQCHITAANSIPSQQSLVVNYIRKQNDKIRI